MAADQRNGVSASSETQLRQFWLESAQNAINHEIAAEEREAERLLSLPPTPSTDGPMIDGRTIDEFMYLRDWRYPQQARAAMERIKAKEEAELKFQSGDPEFIARYRANLASEKAERARRMREEIEYQRQRKSNPERYPDPYKHSFSPEEIKAWLRAQEASESGASLKPGSTTRARRSADQVARDQFGSMQAESEGTPKQPADAQNYDAQHARIASDAESLDALKESAAAGNAAAQYKLSRRYFLGEGTVMNHSEAIVWLRRSAEQEDAEAQINLGSCYMYGNGVVKDETKAVEWIKRAAEQGHAAAQCILGCCYHDGVGGPEDNVSAYAWLSISAASGYTEAKERLEQITSEMTKAEIAKGQQLSKEFQLKQKIDISAQEDQAAVAEKTPPPNTEHRVELTTKSFLARFIESGGAETPGEAVACYAELVDYYDQGQRSRDQIRQDTVEHFRKWPQRSYHLVGEPRIVRESATKDVVTCNVSFEVSDGKRRIEGVAENSITLDVERMKIVSIREKVVKRRATSIDR